MNKRDIHNILKAVEAELLLAERAGFGIDVSVEQDLSDKIRGAHAEPTRPCAITLTTFNPPEGEQP